MTFSVLAADGELIGGAVASHSVGVGSRVLWASPGTGMVATQANTRVEYGEELLGLLASGATVQDALRQCTGADPHAAARQVAVMDGAGRFAQHSGEMCVGSVSTAAGSRACAQGNMLQPGEIAPAMIAAYHESSEQLPDRLLAALRGGQAAGGDSRGTRAAGLLVADGDRIVVDLRVDDHPEPIEELVRLYSESRLQHMIAAAQLAYLGISTDSEDLLGRLADLSSTSPEREADRWMWLALLHAARACPDRAIEAIGRAVLLRESVAFELERFLEQGRVDDEVARILREGLAQ